MPSIVPAGITLIKANEGCRLTAYPDPATGGDPWTIGFGDTGPDVRPGLRITQQEAEDRLTARLAREFEPGVSAAIGDAPTTDNEFSAMISLAYNIGVGAFKGSSVARLHRAGNHAAAASAFALWNKAGGAVLAGLTRRRKEEADLYLRPASVPAAPPVAAAAPQPSAPASDAPTVTPATVVEKIKDVQRDLQVLHLYAGAIDGQVGSGTAGAAMKAYYAATGQ